MNIGWRTKYILALSEDFLIHRWKLSGTMGLAHGFHFHKKTGLWEASYYISVTNETISRAYSPNAIAITGSFSSTYLGLDSNKQATYYLGWKMGILNYNHYLRATIRSGFLSVTY